MRKVWWSRQVDPGESQGTKNARSFISFWISSRHWDLDHLQGALGFPASVLSSSLGVCLPAHFSGHWLSSAVRTNCWVPTFTSTPSLQPGNDIWILARHLSRVLACIQHKAILADHIERKDLLKEYWATQTILGKIIRQCWAHSQAQGMLSHRQDDCQHHTFSQLGKNPAASLLYLGPICAGHAQRDWTPAQLHPGSQFCWHRASLEKNGSPARRGFFCLWSRKQILQGWLNCS